MKMFLILTAAMLALAGCNSFRVTHAESFVDGDGNIVRVQYGTLEKPRKYMMTSPINGNQIECQSKLMVKVALPDDEGVLKCYEGQNSFSRGTMYESMDLEWKYYTTGLKCAIFKRDATKNDYLLVYDGDAIQTNEGKR